MKSIVLVAYVSTVAWLVVGVTIRFYLEVSQGQVPDILPYITATLAIIAILLLVVRRQASPAMLIAMIAWNFVGSAARISYQLNSPTHQVDFIPIVSLAVGVGGLVVLLVSASRPDRETL